MSEPVTPAVPPSSHVGGPRPARPSRGRRGFALAAAGVAAATVGVLALSGTFGGGGASSGSPDGGTTPGAESTGFALAGFDTCEPLLEYYRSHAAQLVGPYGFDNPWLAMTTMGGGAVAAAGAPEAAPNAMRDSATAGKSSTGSTGTTSYTSDTGTTVQVAGVDELDVAKRHGDLLLTVAGNDLGTLTVLRTGRGHPTVVSRLKLGTSGVQGLVLDGTTALVVGGATSRTGISSAMNQEGFPGTELVQVDLSEPTRPRVVHTMTLDGSVSGVRLVDGVVRVVLNSGPHDLPFVAPKLPQPPDGGMTGGAADPGGVAVGPAGEPVPVPDAGTGAGGGKTMPTPPNQADLREYQKAYEQALAEATAANQKVVREAELLRFLPTFRLRTPGGPDAAGILTGCSDISAPQRFSGLDTLTLATFDLRAKGLAEQSSAAVIATGSTLYATAEHTYLATSEYAWRGGPMPMVGGGVAVDEAATGGVAKSIAQLPVTAATTQLHLFDTTGRSAPAYQGSGQVKGHLLNQFAMDEYQGVLRVATTVQPTMVEQPMVGGPAVAATPRSGTSSLMTSQSQVATLKLVGDTLVQQGVISGLGRGEQIRGVRFDGPLGYVVTFRQTDPLFTIDLHSPAHPTLAGELKLLGYSAYLQPVGPGLLLGVGQDADGAGRQRGLQLSLFDVTNPAAPRRVSQLRLPNTNSSAEYDYHAVTVADGLVLLPTTSMGGPTMAAPTVEVAPAPATDKPAAPDAVPGTGTAAMPVMPSATTVLAVPLTGRRFGTPHTLVVPSTDQGTTTRTFVDAHDIWTLTNDSLADHDRTTWRRVAVVRF